MDAKVLKVFVFSDHGFTLEDFILAAGVFDHQLEWTRTEIWLMIWHEGSPP